MPAGHRAYRRSGVDLEAGARAVELIRSIAEGATRPEVAGGIGGFAGLVDLGDGRYLAAATDGVGTKIEVARAAGVLDTVGIDLVAMSANDVACTGAEPLFFLDYLSVGKVVPEDVATIVSGVAEGCRRAECALLGGETAEHPGMEPGEFDLAGFCVGIVAEGRLLGPAKVEAGDALIGLRSSGLHANGFSLVRAALLRDGGLELDEFVPELGKTLVEELLEPTSIYVRPVMALRDAGMARSAAHITGGGFIENVPRALPGGLGAEIDPSAWELPPVFRLVAKAAGVPVEELYGVLNMGIGMAVAVRDSDARAAIDAANAAGASAVRIGSVIEGSGVRMSRTPT